MKNVKQFYEKLMLTIIAFALVGIFIQNQYSINQISSSQSVKHRNVNPTSLFTNHKDIIDDGYIHYFKCEDHDAYYALDHFFNDH